MAFKIVSDFPNEILDEIETPCISLYQPTHRHRPSNKQDSVRFKNLVKKVEESLKSSYPKKEVDQMLKPFNDLAKDTNFWNHTLDGLAILATGNRGIIYNLQRTVKELAVVADSFHIKPLIRIFQSADRYQLLGLNRNEFSLYEGNRYGFEKVEFESGVATTAEEVLGEEYSEKYLTFGTYAGVEGVGTFHGHGGKKEEKDKYMERFFRYVDKFVWENYSKPSGLPLVLVSLAEYHPIFQSISRNPHLSKDGIKTAFTALSMEELKDSAWGQIEQQYLERTKSLVDRFESARADFMASDDLADIARAANGNRVSTLLVESDRIIPGKVDPSGRLTLGNSNSAGYDDVLDDLAEMVLKSKGEVVVLPFERMPTSSGAAAIYRY